MSLKLIWALFQKEVVLELRQKYTINGIILYVFATLFIIQLGFQSRVSPQVWISLYWIVILFASVNAGAKSFIQEGRNRMLYYYTISSPENIIFSKLLHNCLLLGGLALMTYGGFALFFSNAIQNNGLFMLVLLLGSTGFAAIFTMVSAISSKAKGSATLMTILSFPAIVPQLMLLIKLTKRAVDGFDLASGLKDILLLSAINIIVVVVSYLLFPYLWRD